MEKALTNKKAFLLCAGKGTRFYPHTRILPKVLLPFLNLPLVVYNMYLLKVLGVSEWAANTHAHSDFLQSELSRQAQMMRMKQPLFSYEEKLLGSAGGLLKLKSFFEREEHFFYLNGDSFIWLDQESDLQDFYKLHLKSGALASFLVCPADKEKGVIWADKESGEVYSFLKNPDIESKNIRAYNFSGLAVFSGAVLKKIKLGDFHIFKDVLEIFIVRKKHIKSYFRVHSIPSLKLLDMNQVGTYLQATKKALCFLRDKRTSAPSFLHNILSFCSPNWKSFEGENYFSAFPVKHLPEDKKNILFCGRSVKGLEKVSVRNFAVVGDYCSFSSSLYLNSSVLGENVSLHQSMKDTFLLRDSGSSPE